MEDESGVESLYGRTGTKEKRRKGMEVGGSVER